MRVLMRGEAQVLPVQLEDRGDEPVVERRDEPRFVPLSMLLGLVMTAIYILGFAYVGFYVSTFVFLFGYSLLIEPPDERNGVSKALFAFISVAVLYGLFSVFKIYLPTTWLF